ncbi:MAG: hypothetical protein QGH20_09390, partial [Candidatus Latescibacteria bacterium]|nr:hypothetical protein [Candidatus Latescibacterota bacterium]
MIDRYNLRRFTTAGCHLSAGSAGPAMRFWETYHAPWITVSLFFSALSAHRLKHRLRLMQPAD